MTDSEIDLKKNIQGYTWLLASSLPSFEKIRLPSFEKNQICPWLAATLPS